MDPTFGGIGILALLLGGLAIAAIGGGGSEDSDEDAPMEPIEPVEPVDPVNPVEPVVPVLPILPVDPPVIVDQPEPVAPEVEPLPALEGTAGDDTLTGDDETGDVLGFAGNDFILSAGANGTLDGGEGDDDVVLNTGAATLTGGAGADLYIVAGDETADAPTHGTITDFDPETDQLLLYFRQPDVGPDELPVSPALAQLTVTETETADGPVVELELSARPGAEELLSGVGFAKVTLIGVEESELTDDNLGIGIDETDSPEKQAVLFETVAEAIRTYGNAFDIVDENESVFFADEQAGVEALFGLDGNDILGVTDFDTADLFGGDGNDQLVSGVGAGGNFFGGEGDDSLSMDNAGVLTGGAGIDDFRVNYDNGAVPSNDTVTITDFDPATETLQLSAVISLDDMPDVMLAGETDVVLTETTQDGVSGTLVTPVVLATDPADNIIGRPVFLQNVQSADIPAGAITFLPPTIV